MTTRAAAPKSAPSPPPQPSAARDERSLASLTELEARLEDPSVPLDSARRAALHRERGRLFEYLGQLPEAQASYQAAREALGADELGLVAALHRVAAALGQEPLATELCEREAQLSLDPPRQADLYHEQGRRLARGGDDAGAARAFERAVKLAPGDLRYADSWVFAQTGASAEAATDAAHLARLAATTGQGELRAALLAQHGDLLALRLERAEAARAAYLEALAAHPRAPGAIPMLDTLLTGAEDWAELAELVARAVEAAPAGGSQGSSMLRLARLLRDHQERGDDALALMQGAAALLPGYLAPLEELRALALERDDPERLVAALQGLAEASDSAPDGAELWYRAGRLREGRHGDEDGAVACFAQALFAEAGHPEARHALDRALSRRGEWARLAQTLEASAKGAPPELELGALRRAAELCERHLGEPERALALHRRLLASTPEHLPSVHAVLRLLQALGRHAELAEAYRAAAATAATGDERAAFLLRRGELLELLLDSPGEAITSFRQSLESGAGQRAAIHALRRTAPRSERWEELVVALELDAGGRTGASAGDVLHELGEVLERELDRPDAALEQYRRALAAAPAHPLATVSIEALLDRLGHHAELARHYRATLAHTEDEPRRAELGWRVGRLEALLGDRTSAIATLTPAACGGHPGARRELESLLTLERRWTELARCLETGRAELEGAERLRVETRLGMLLEHELGDPSAARAAYERALEFDADCPDALAGRARTIGALRDWPALAECLNREAERSLGEPRTTALYRAGVLARDRLGDHGAALVSFEAVVDQEPSHLGALLALVPLYERAERLEDVTRVLASLGRELSDDASRSAMMFRLTETAERGAFGTPAQLAQAYRKLASEPVHRLGALLKLERLALQGPPALRAEAAERLAPLCQDPELAAGYLVELGELAEENDTEAALGYFSSALAREPTSLSALAGLARVAQARHQSGELELAATRHSALGDAPRSAELFRLAAAEHAADGQVAAAATALWRALGVSADHAAARHDLAELVRAHELAEVLAALDRVSAPDGPGGAPEEPRAQWIALAEALADEPERATALLERATADGPMRPAVQLALAGYCARRGDVPRAVTLLAEVLRDAPPGPERSRASLAWARLAQGPLGDARRAQELYEDVVADAEAEAADVEAALGDLVELRTAAGNLDDAIAAATALGRRARAPATRLAAWQSVVDLELGRDGTAEAVVACGELIALEGPRSPAVATLRELSGGEAALHDGAFAALARALETYARTATSPADAAAAYALAARALADEVGDLRAARELIERGCAALPLERALALELGRRLEQEGAITTAVAQYQRLLAEEPTLPAALRGLARGFGRLTPQRPPSVVLAVLESLGAATPAERERNAARSPRALATAAPPFAELRPLIGAASPTFAALDAFHDAIAEHLGRVHVPRLRELGLESGDRLGHKGEHPLRTLAERLGRLLGVADFHLYLARDDEPTPRFAFTSPPSLVLPAALATASEGAQRFVLAKALGPLALGRQALSQVDARGMRELIAAALRATEGEAELSFAAIDRVARLFRRFVAVPELPALATRARAVAETDDATLDAWIGDTQKTATRLGLVLSDDLTASLASLAPYPEAQRGGTDDELREFFLSDAAFALRALGLEPAAPEEPPPES